MKRGVSHRLRLLRQAASASVRRVYGAYRLGRVSVRNLGKENIRDLRGRCLVSYVPWFIGFVRQHPDVGKNGWDPGSLAPKLENLASEFHPHSMYWESAELVRQLIDRGYIVDCIYGRDGSLVEDVSAYDVLVDEWDNLPRWASQNPVSRRLYYATGCHWIYHNKAELARHEWLFQRRGVVAATARQVPPILSPAAANIISYFGNSATRATYGSFSEKLRKLWVSAVERPSSLGPRDWRRAQDSYVWYGGGGWIHKGLDLVVEAFLKEPRLRLRILGGDLRGDADFWRIYGKAIEEAGNITYHGFIHPGSPEFREVSETTCAVVYPSAAEGCSGAVVQCMHFGLIPLVTEVTGLSIHDAWAPLDGSSDKDLIESIRARCHEVRKMPPVEAEEWRQFFWDYSGQHHTREAYSQSLSLVLDELLQQGER